MSIISSKSQHLLVSHSYHDDVQEAGEALADVTQLSEAAGPPGSSDLVFCRRESGSLTHRAQTTCSDLLCQTLPVLNAKADLLECADKKRSNNIGVLQETIVYFDFF